MSNKLNGSVNLLADAMRQVFTECMDLNRKAMKDDLDHGISELSHKIDTTNLNMQAQFAEQEKKLSKAIKQTKNA